VANKLDLFWLVARPIAHRGLHDAAKGVIENSVSAARAAIRAGYAIECDVQLSKDGEVVVFHDDTLERLTAAEGRVETKSAAELASLSLRGADDTIPLFADFLAAIAGKTPLVVEIKSNFDGDPTLARRVAEIAARYEGPLVIESFDPDPIAFLREEGEALGISHVPLGMVAMARYEADEWPGLPPARRAELTHFLHFSRTRPDFLSWNVDDLPHAIPLLLREGLNLPVTVWTVRSQGQAQFAAQFADQIVFEGFAPR
jgi:glycerophosphoryl diester phosphodiesterase